MARGRKRKPSKRRHNGAGSVRQLPSGAWEYRNRIEDPPGSGVRRRVSGTEPSRSEAEAASQLLQVSARQGKLRSTAHTTLRELSTDWFDTKRHDVEDSTLAEYKHKLGHLEPLLDYRLASLNSALVDRLVSKLRDQGLSPSYVGRIVALLSSIIQLGVRREMVVRNWVEDVKRPRMERKSPSALTGGQVRDFLQAAQRHRLYALFYVAVATGMRRGELIGLHDEDFETLANGGGAYLHVRRSVTEPGSKLEVKLPKTKASMRRVHVLDDVIEVLQKHQERQLLELEEGGWGPSNVLFSSSVGTYLRPRNLHRTFKAIAKQATIDVDGVGLHELRRTHTSLYLRQGSGLEATAQRLGHADSHVTLRHYRHLYQEEITGSTLTLEQMLGEPPLAPPMADKWPTTGGLAGGTGDNGPN